MRVADRIYAWEGHAWSLRNAWLTDSVIHVLGRDLNAAAWIALLGLWLWTGWRTPGAPVRRPLAYLLLATLVSCLAVSWIKSWSNMDCPWDLVRYGGPREFVGLMDLRPLGMGRGRCFPAGHASAGYAWVALYFFFMAVAPRWRWLGLATGVGLGLLFGISQQLRGAHFLSHDLYTAGICWLTALVLYVVMLGTPAKARAVTDGRVAS
jgi:membrane-associated PAP2 superfamily phosphatase